MLEFHPCRSFSLARAMAHVNQPVACCAVGDVEQIGKGVAVAESLIGSRPPRCEGKCAPCGRCEAVQVPVAPRVDGGRGEAEPGRARPFGRAAGAGARGQESYTDYKPLNWKCRCADRRALDP